MSNATYVRDGNGIERVGFARIATITKERTAEVSELLRLANAAPDLLAALEGLVKWIDEGRIACDLTFYSEPARAAIAKATGK